MLTAPGSSLSPATTLEEALDALVPEPLQFEGERPSGEALYAPRPERFEDGLRVPGPAETLRDRLLGSTFATKVFLSGHVGSGKSTELRRLAASDAIRAAFSPIFLTIEEGYRQHLDIAQLLYLMACAIFDFGQKNGLLSFENAWTGPLRELDQRLFGESGLHAAQGAISTEWNLFFVKVRQELKLEDRRRRQFREIAETQLTILLDLVKGLDLDIRKNLALKGDARSPLLLIDDLDKVRERAPQEDVFRKNVAVLFDPPLRVLYTLPTGVAFDRCPPMLRQARVHLYPVPILRKQVPGSPVFDPERSINEVGLPFLDAVLRSRVAPGLFDAGAVRMAAVHSGGVLRAFFWLLRAGADLSRANDLRAVDGRVMRVAIKNERLNESQAMREEDYRALAEAHRTNAFSHGTDTSLLDYSYIIECYNDKVWYEANPVLWPLLEPYSR